ncbi:class I SAM-dependent methyltransferase [Mucilaginibacter sp. McL0603]|uniref:class I SAM-dependent methyltransferase n=1 Tax=Mucilaginibacter sp. McL0603 TaxID=3415670 RepID=UPI003CE75B09
MEKKEAFKFTGEDAENYDFYLGPILFEPYARYLSSKIDTANVKSVLEIACGTGRVTRHIRKTLPADIKFTATDISNDMLNVAKRELDNKQIDFQTEDAQNLSFPDNSFDLVICQFGMMFLPDKKKGFEEIYRVLTPGGKFMFFTWDNTLSMPLFRLLVNDLVVPHFEDEDTTRFFVPFSLHQPKVLTDWMKSAGFKNIETNNVVLKSGSPSAKNIADGLFRKHPLGREISAKNPAAFEPVAMKFEREIEIKSGAKNPVIDLSAFLTSGIK